MIELPWPPSCLVPHAKGHWRTKSKATKEMRTQCGWIAKSHPPLIEFKVEFHHPKGRGGKRDLHNAISACKASIDGLQDAWGINDKDFIIHWPTKYDEPVEGGKVVIKKV